MAAAVRLSSTMFVEASGVRGPTMYLVRWTLFGGLYAAGIGGRVVAVDSPSVSSPEDWRATGVLRGPRGLFAMTMLEVPSATLLA
jgi:hypothetical protein